MSTSERGAPRGLPYTTDLTYQSGDLIFACDRRGRIVFWNPECERLLGRPASETLGHSFEVICHRQSGAHPIDTKSVLSGRDFAGDVRCLNRAGAEVTLYLFATAGRNKAGDPAGVVFVGRDVTGLWQAEEVARSSHDRYRLLFENTTDSVAIAHTDGRVIEVNPACVRMYGYTTDEVKGMNLVDIVAPESREDAALAMANLASGKPATGTLKVVRKDGTRFVVDFSAYVVLFGGDQRVFSVTRDVTARALAEETTRASERKYRAIFASVADAVFLETFDGRILEVNDNACRLLGYARDELLSLRVSDLVPPDARAWLPSINDTILRTGSFRAEAVNIRKDGSAVPVEISAATIEVEGRTLAILLARDISERKEAEAKLRASEDRYRTIFESTGTAMLVIEEDMTIALTNQEFEMQFGYQRTEVVGRPWIELLTTEDAARMVEYHRMRRRPGDKPPRNYEFRMHDKAGTTRDCLITVEIVPGTRRSIASIVDVTERKRAEAELAASEERYRDLFNNSPIGIYRTTPGGEIRMANPALVRMLGCKSYAELAARNLEQNGFNPDYPRSRFRETLERDGSISGLETEWLTKDGRTIFVRENARVVRSDEGQVLYYEGTVEDITERKAAEAALAASEERYRNLFNNSPIGIYRTTPDGEIKMANPALVKMLGYRSFAELATRNLERDGFSPSYSRAEFRERLEREGEVVGLEGTRLTYDGRTIHVRENARVVRDAAGRVMYYEGTEEDITEQKLAEKAAREEKARAELYLSLVGVMVVAIDSDGRVSLVNRRGCEVLGRSEDELIGKDWFECCIPARLRADVRSVFKQVMRGESETSEFHENPVLTASGKERLVAWRNTVLLDADGKPAGTLASGEDITDRKAAEAALRESEEKFRSVSEQSPNMIFINSRGRVVYANRMSEKLMGYTRDEFYAPAFDFMKLIAPESVAQIRAAFARHGRGEDVEPYDYSLVTKSGRRIESIITTKLIDYDGSKAILGIITDVTEHRAADRALLEAEKQYHAALDAMHDPIHVADADLRIVMVNRAFLRWLAEQGIDDSVQGKTIFDAFPFLSKKVREEYRQVLETGHPLVTEEKTKVGGRTYFTETTKMPVVEGDKVVHVLTVVRDVTERRTIEAALRESEERYRRLVDESPDGVAVHQDGKVLMMNRAGARVLGYDDPAEVVGAPVVDFLHPDDRAEVLARMRKTAEFGSTGKTARARFRRRDGAYVPLDVGSAALPWAGGIAVQVVFRDVSGREAAERTLRESEENFRAMAENASDAVFIYTEDGRFVYCNARGVELTGYPLERLRTVTMTDVLRPEDVETIRGRVMRRLRGEEPPARYELSIIRSDGKVVPVELTANRTVWRGQPAGIVSIHDIAERKVAEQALAASEARYRNLVDSIRDGIFTLDRYGRFASVNEVIVQRSGRPREWWLGRDCASVVLSEYRDTVKAMYEATMRGELVAPFEVGYLTAAAAPVHVEMHLSSLSEDGNVTGALAIARDITERKLAEQRMMESEDKYRRLVELSPDGIAILQDGKIVMVNQAGASLMSYASPAEMIGRPLLDSVYQEDRPRVIERLSRVIEQGRPTELAEVRYVRKDGSLVPVEVVSAPFAWNGRPAIQVVARDISERKRLAEAAETVADQLHAVLDSSPEAVATECEGVLVYANQHFAGLFGYDSPEQVIGRPAADFDAPDDREMMVEYTRMRERGEEAPTRYTFRGLKRDGTTGQFQAAITTYRSLGKLHILAFIRPIDLGRDSD